MRKSISVTFFSMVATLLVLGTAVLGCSEWLLFSRYFAQERYDTLDSVADVTQRAADYIVQQAALPKGAELDALNTKLEIIGESAEAYLFFTDEEGRILIASNPEMVGTDIVGPELMKKSCRGSALPHPEHAGRCADREKAMSRCGTCRMPGATTAAISSSAPPVRG